MTRVTRPRSVASRRRLLNPTRLTATALAAGTAAGVMVGGAAHRPLRTTAMATTTTARPGAAVLASSMQAPIVGEAPLPQGGGFWVAYTNGAVVAEGSAAPHGDLSKVALNAPIVSITSTADGRGYWMLAADGGVFSFGDARFYGSTGNLRLARPVVAMAATPTGHGYWLVAADGGVFSFGDARFHGSTGNIRLARPVVGMAASASGRGYWLVASDGGVFAFGGARFYGSTGNVRLAQPVVGMTSTGDHGGYWLAGADGGVFAFGDARFRGSAAGRLGAARAVGLQAAGAGYWMLTSAGFVDSFGAPAVPSANPPATVPITAIAPPPPVPTGPAGPAGMPSAANTGVQPGASLLNLDHVGAGPLSGANSSPAGCASWQPGSGLWTNRDGCTIHNVQWTGDFVVQNNNTTLDNVRIIGPGTEASNNMIVQVNWGGGNYTGTEISHSDIHDGTSSGSVYCVAGFNFSMDSDNVSGCTHLFNLYGQSDHVAIRNSFLHGPIAYPSDHVELLYASPGASDVTITGDNWDISPVGGTTACLFLDGTNQDRNWNVSGNWFNGTQAGSSNWDTIQADTSGITFQNNKLGLDSVYGPYLFNSYMPSASGGNVWEYSGTTPSSWSSGGGRPVTAGTEVPGI